MIKFQDKSILTNYIKELLHTFNLPTPMVYISDEITKPVTGGLYIKDNNIVICTSGYVATTGASATFDIIEPFVYDKPLMHYTNNLKINNLIYDSHTHEYLGEYLRFLRDYKKLDLMSMYNCFSNNIALNIEPDDTILELGDKAEYMIAGRTYGWSNTSAPAWPIKDFGDPKATSKYYLKISNLSNIVPADEIKENFQRNVPYRTEDYAFIGFAPVETSQGNFTPQFVFYNKDFDIQFVGFKGSFTFTFEGIVKSDNITYAKNKFLEFNSITINLYNKIPLNFSSEDKNYKIYMVPVKFFKDYTIAISCNTPYELVCGFYTKGQLSKDSLTFLPKPTDPTKPTASEVLTENLNHLKSQTYKYIPHSSFNLPFIYSGLNPSDSSKIDELNNALLREHEKDLKLFIKLPVTCNSSITILEGNYLNRNDKSIDKDYYVDPETHVKYFYVDEARNERVYLPEGHDDVRDNSERDVWKNNKSVINFKESQIKGFIEDSQLTLNNQNVTETETIYVPSDPDDPSSPKIAVERSVTYPKTIKQYDTEEIDITDFDSMTYISNIQLLNFNSNVSYPFADKLIEYLCDNAITNIETISDNILRLQEVLVKRYWDSIKDNKATKSGLKSYTYPGLWENKYRAVLYEIASKEGLLDSQHDILGYCDKNIESTIGEVDIYNKEG